jgi:nucleoside-diphosphate-sugar epimerase
MVKILITGSSGYLGQHLLHALIRKKVLSSESDDNNNIEIYATYGSMQGFHDQVMSSLNDSSLSSHDDAIYNDNNNNNDNNNDNDIDNRATHNVHVDKLDLTNSKDVQAYVLSNGPFNLCYHLAAISSPRVCQGNEEKTQCTNIPKHLFSQLRSMKTPIIALSTDQVYCGAQQASYVEEGKAKKLPPPVNIYAQSKLDMESVLYNYHSDQVQQHSESESQSSPVVCLRSSIILGPLAPFGGAHSTFLHFCQSRHGQQTTFYTDEIRSVVAVRDVVQVLLYFFTMVQTKQSFASGVYNMGGSDHDISRMDMARAVAKECSFSDDVFIAAEKSKIVPGPNDVPSPLNISMNSTKLEELVGFQFSGLETIVRETFEG